MRKTALYKAVKEHMLEVVKMLLEIGANPNEKTEDGYGSFPITKAINGSFHSTAKPGDLEKVVQALLECGADPGTKRCRGHNS